MSNAIVNVTRGNIVESKHNVSIVVANSSGEIIASAGDENLITYMRSAAKPLQALNVILSKAYEKYNFTDEQLAIMCASHYGEEMHRKVISEILEKIECTKNDLLCGSPLSISEDYMKEQLLNHHKIDQLNSDCSGKHSGFLSVCKTKGYPIETYNQPDHPMQKEVLQVISSMCDIKPENIFIGTDGCGVPVHGMPIKNMSIGYAKLATPDKLDENYKFACNKIFDAMNAHPEMIAGTNGFCTELIKNTNGRLCGKLGAEGIYCIGIKDKDMGINVKVEDGNFRALYPAVMSTLIQLDLLRDSEIKSLDRFVKPVIYSNTKLPIGNIIADFKLNFK